MADELAKKGASLQQIINNSLPFQPLNELFFKRPYNLKKKLDSFLGRLRQVAVAHFRLFTKHDCINVFLHRFKLASDPMLFHTTRPLNYRCLPHSLGANIAD